MGSARRSRNAAEHGWLTGLPELPLRYPEFWDHSYALAYCSLHQSMLDRSSPASPDYCDSGLPTRSHNDQELVQQFHQMQHGAYLNCAGSGKKSLLESVGAHSRKCRCFPKELQEDLLLTSALFPPIHWSLSNSSIMGRCALIERSLIATFRSRHAIDIHGCCRGPMNSRLLKKGRFCIKCGE